MEKICPNCFEEIDTRQRVCPHCQYDTGKNRDHYPNALPYGTVLAGRYIVGRVLGQGGFGITYLARDYKNHALCAIKEYLPQSFASRTDRLTISAHNIRQRDYFEHGKASFLREAQTLSEFGLHPNIVKVYQYFEENGTAYFVMEYIRGMDLSTYLHRNGGSLSWNETWGLMRPVLIALNAIHRNGIIHRDIKPENIFITEDRRSVLLDFGSARYSTGEFSQSLSVILTPGYAPHEQYSGRGRQGPFTDVYGLAATMYRMLTGRKPPDSVDRVVEDEILQPEYLGAALPPGVSNALLHALAVMPADRTGTMMDFLDEIEQKNPFVGNAEQITYDGVDPERDQEEKVPSKPPRRKWILPLIIGILILCAATAGILFATGVFSSKTSETKIEAIDKEDGEEENGGDVQPTDDTYVLPESNTRYYKSAELTVLSKDELCYARNEIYARHGLLFKDPDIQAFFNNKKWYKGEVYIENFDTSVFNTYESANIKLIKEAEAAYDTGGSNADKTVKNSDYLLPDSASRNYTRSEIVALSKHDRCMARNEIYARHGLLFKDSEIQAYFNAKSWYKGKVYIENFDTSVLNQYEVANVSLILSIEEEFGAY